MFKRETQGARLAVMARCPTLTDGVVVLDAFSSDDVDAHVGGEDEEQARRFATLRWLRLSNGHVTGLKTEQLAPSRSGTPTLVI